jgi:HEPN domain-containing protein
MNDRFDLYIANLLRLAYIDLQDANWLAQRGSRNDVYHLEQSAEKIIRAILASEEVNAPANHLLDRFVAAIPDVNPFKKRLEEVVDLMDYATTYRYATTKGRIKAPPPEAYFGDRYNKVASLLADVAARFQVDLTKENLPAGKPDPIR